METKTLGAKTLAYYIFVKTIFSFLILLVAVYLPNISQFFIETLHITLTPATTALVNNGGHILVAILFILFIFVFVLGIITSLIKYFNTTYALEPYDFKLRRGIISRDDISIPYKQIQDVDVNQTILFRIFGLASLAVLSGGNDTDNKRDQADEIFSVIDNDLARNLRADLLKRSNIQQVQEVKE